MSAVLGQAASSPTPGGVGSGPSAERLHMLREVDHAILAGRSPQAIAEAALERMSRLVPSPGASLVVFDFETHAATVLAAVGQGQAVAGTRLSLEACDQELLRWGRVDVVQDLLGVPRPGPWLQALRAGGWRSCLSAPVRAQDALLGSLSLLARRPGLFTAEVIDTVAELADRLAVALQTARLVEQGRAGRDQLESLSRRLLEVQELERRHLASELHDEIGQVLTAVKVNLQALQGLPGGATPHLEESIGLVDQALQQVRNLSADLRPCLLDRFGLEPALRWYIQRLVQRAGLTILFVADRLEGRLPAELETACFRVVQEALTNVVRHARARKVSVALRQRGGEVRLSIRDDGGGFDVRGALRGAARGASLGLLSMRERVRLARGRIAITSAPGRGTKVCAHFPLTLRSSQPPA